MSEKRRIGFAMCGSYCTYDAVFTQAEKLARKYSLVPIMSERAASTDTRFGAASENVKRLADMCNADVVTTIAGAEQLGPKYPMEALIIAPCTGNTLAKLANGITDSAVTMAAKAHLRNSRPLIIALSTNDGLSGSAENIAKLLNRKNVYFVPFRQDDPAKKPFSLQADFALLEQTLEAALKGWQLQPLIILNSNKTV